MLLHRKRCRSLLIRSVLSIYSTADLLFVGPVLFFEVTTKAVFSPQICIQVNVSARQISLLYTQEQFVFALHCCWRCCASLPEGRCVSLVTRVAFCLAAPLGISEQSVCVCLQCALFVCIVHKLACFCIWSVNILMCNQVSSLWIVCFHCPVSVVVHCKCLSYYSWGISLCFLLHWNWGLYMFLGPNIKLKTHFFPSEYFAQIIKIKAQVSLMAVCCASGFSICFMLTPAVTHPLQLSGYIIFTVVTEENLPRLSRNKQAHHVITDCTPSDPSLLPVSVTQVTTSWAFRWQHSPSVWRKDPP